MSEWRKSPAVALVIVTLFLIIQLGLPLSRLGEHDRAPRFGWQMFSVFSQEVEFRVHTADSSESIELDDIMAIVRADLPLEEGVPPHLCRITPEAVRITWEGGEYQCSAG